MTQQIIHSTRPDRAFCVSVTLLQPASPVAAPAAPAALDFADDTWLNHSLNQKQGGSSPAELGCAAPAYPVNMPQEASDDIPF